MKFAKFLPMKHVVIGCLCVGALGAAACEDALKPIASGALHVTKECSAYTGLAGSFCTITSSNVTEIPVGSRVVYAQAAGATSLDTDIVLNPPSSGNGTAAGHCALDFGTGRGLCTFSGGTGVFTSFHATNAVSHLGGNDWAWDGTYSSGSN
jgi:hypothetical protein